MMFSLEKATAVMVVIAVVMLMLDSLVLSPVLALSALRVVLLLLARCMEETIR